MINGGLWTSSDGTNWIKNSLFFFKDILTAIVKIGDVYYLVTDGNALLTYKIGFLTFSKKKFFLVPV